MTKKVAASIDPVCMELVRAGLLTYKQLNEVHRLVQETGGSIDDALVSKGLVSREQLAKRRAPRTGKPALKIGYSLDLVKSGLLTFKQLNECHREARSTRGAKTVVDVMLEKGYVSDVQLATITPSSQGAKHKKFSSSWDLFRAGAVSLKALNDCHRHIKLESPEKSLKEALLERGYITRDKLEELEKKRARGEQARLEGAARSPFIEKYAAELEGIPDDLKEKLRREHLASEEEDQGRADFQGSQTLMEVEPEERAPDAKKDVGFQSAQTMMGGDDEVAAPPKAPDFQGQNTVMDLADGDGPATRVLRGAKTFLTEEAASFRSEKTVMGDDEGEGTAEFRAAQTFMDGGAPEKPKETDSGADIRGAQTFLDAGDAAATGSDPDLRGASTFLDVGEEAARSAPKAAPQQGGTFMDMDVESAGPAGMFGGSETGSGVGPGMLRESRSGGGGAEFQRADTQTGVEREGDTFMDVDTPKGQTQSAAMREAFEKAGKSASSSSKTDVDVKTPSKTDVGSASGTGTGSSTGTGTSAGTGAGSGTGTGTGTGSSAAGTKASTGGTTEAQTGAAKPAKKKKDEEDAYNHPLVGKVIGGCRIVKKLGEGGMGAVFLAEHTKLKRQSVIKVVPAHLSQNKQLIERFRREAQAAAVVQHPNIVAVHNVGEENGVHYIEMEYVDGSALDAELKEKKFIEPIECLRIIKDACRGLAEAHKNGITHRDIKPDNIMMTRKRQVKIADFGLARVRGSEEMELTKVGQILGTPAYMSPEQCQGKPTDHRADIYSLGATFYAMITGKRPFTGSSVMDIMKKHIDEAPNSPREYNRDNNLPDVAVPIEQVILQMMAKKPEERFQSAEDVIDAIDRFMRAEGTEHLLEVQKLLGGDYKLLKKLGQGGMGAVYSAKANRAKDRVKAGDLVAIKVLNREVNPEEVTRFEQEAKLALEIDHENIIRVLEYRISPDMNYIVMEFIEGKSVRDIIRDQKKLAPKEAVRIVREAAKGLGRAHELGIIHRDIKPDNLMIAKSGTVKVADFGIAKHVEGASELTQAGVVVGTPHYMSPEQCVGASRGIKITTQADIYSLGATLYFMVTGQKPFEGDTQMTIILQHLNQAPTPPRQIDENVDESLSNVVLNMMAKKPRYRYATLGDVVKDVDAAERGKRVKKHRKVDVSFEETGRNKLLVGVGAGVIAALFFAVFAVGRKDTVGTMNGELDKGKSAVEKLLQEKKFNAALDLAKATESKVFSYDTSKQYEARFKDRLNALMQSAQGPKDANDKAVLDLRTRLDQELKAAQASAEQIRTLADEIVLDGMRQPCFEHYGKAYALGEDANAANFGDDPIVTREEGSKVCREILIELDALGEKRLGLEVAYVERELVRDKKFYQAAQADLESFGRNWGELRVPGYDAQKVVALSNATRTKAEDYKSKDEREFPGNLGKVEQICYAAFAAEAREIERGYAGQKKRSGEVSTRNIVKIFQEARETASKYPEAATSLHKKLIDEHFDIVSSSLEQSARNDVRTALAEINDLVRTLTPNKLARAQTAAQRVDQLAESIRERFGDAFAEELKTAAGKQIPRVASEAWTARKEGLEAISWGSKTSPLTGTPNGARRFLEAASAYKAIMDDDEAKFPIEVTVEGKVEAVAIRKLAEKELSELNYNLSLLAPFSEANNNGNMHLVQAGSFLFGTDDADAPPNQRPAQPVDVRKNFFIDRTEATVGEYDHFLHTDESGRYRADLDTKDKRLFLCFQHDPDLRFCYPGEPSSPTGHLPRNFDPQHGKTPVQFVTWYDAYAFAHWAGKRLPTEQEWEKAASWDPEKKKKNAYPWGDTFDSKLLVAASADDQWPELKGVGQILGNRSPFGPLDMAGSLWEWAEDAYKGYPGSKYLDPDYGERFKVIRGGSYEDHREAAFRTTYRDRRLPEESYENVGFRCVRVADEGEKK